MIADDTAKAKTTFFDTSAAMLLETDCKTMINQLGYTDPRILPAPLTNILGKTKIFQMRFSVSSKPGNVDFVVDHVFEDKVILQNESEAKEQNIEQQKKPGTSTTQPGTSTTTQADTSTTLAPNFVASVAPVTPAPATPGPILSVSYLQKRPRQSSTKKALFQTSGC